MGFLAPTASARGVRLTSSEGALLRVINSVRAQSGLARLRPDAHLERAARAHSTDMLRRGYFDHGDFAARMSRFGCRGPYLGENLAWGTGRLGPAEVVRMWLASPGHRANLLHPGLRRLGVATPTGSFEGYGVSTVVTADFAGS
ncbi:MAG: CAP domain-containing protein [Gaiellaceae bacterium]